MRDLSSRLEAAALSLTGPGTIKDRLLDAYCTHLEDVQESDLPGALNAEFAEMIQALHRARASRGFLSDSLFGTHTSFPSKDSTSA